MPRPLHVHPWTSRPEQRSSRRPRCLRLLRATSSRGGAVEGERVTAKASKDGLGVVDVAEDVLCCLIVQRVQHLTVHGFRRFGERGPR